MVAVSVLMPTYNGARHVRDAIASVQSQDGVDWELIVSDDGSTDETMELVAGIQDPRVRIINNSVNVGPERNWNRLLSLAQGRYVKLLPQDDLLMPGSLAEQVRILTADREEALALAFGPRVIIDRRGRRLAVRGLGKRGSGRLDAAALARACVRKGTNIIGEPAAVLFRRSLAERIGGFNGAQGYVIDLDYWLRLLTHGDAWYSAEPVSAFRVAQGSWSIAIGRNQSRQFTDFVDRATAARIVAPSAIDRLLGRAQAQLNQMLRLVFYRLFVR